MIIHLCHSLELENGGVAEACFRLNESFNSKKFESKVLGDSEFGRINCNYLLAHGLWQWPSYQAWKNFKKAGTPYLVFPHGMLDPWFKKTYPFKHLKKQVYWWWRQGKILRDAHAVCFTTEEECLLARKTFWPYKCSEVVTGLGVSDPPNKKNVQLQAFETRFPKIKDKRILLYLGRFHPKKGVDLLINSFLKNSDSESILLLAGPVVDSDKHFRTLKKLSSENKNQIIWAGMLKEDLKWGALRAADALILPSHQENFGMVIAEALSVGTPVFLTNKVNLWREVKESNAGIVAADDEEGINQLVRKWVLKKHLACIKNTQICFREKFHISQTVENIISTLSPK